MREFDLSFQAVDDEGYVYEVDSLGHAIGNPIRRVDSLGNEIEMDTTYVPEFKISVTPVKKKKK